MSYYIVENARNVAKQTKELASRRGLVAMSSGSFELGDVRELVMATQEEKPNDLHHWTDDKGALHLCASWYGNGEGKPFITLYAIEE